MRARVLLPAVITALASLHPAPAAVPTALITASIYRYAPGNSDASTGPLQVSAGWGLELLNLDPLGPHTVTAVDSIDGSPIFDSDPVNFGSPAEVRGVETLAPGTYEFYCNVHYFMHGTLQII